MKWLSDRAVERLREAADAPDLSGTRYRLFERLGRGGMGTVYLAEDTALCRRLAIKVLHEPDAPADFAARLTREAQILARLEHPGIVPVHDVGTLADGRVFYTMKYVQGARLDRHCERVPALADRLRIFERICEAVAFAHAQGVLHRDLKPQNVMVGTFGEVLVMDWGVAKILRAAQEEPSAASQWVIAGPPAKTEHGAVLGTPGYMAPEQARGETEKVDQRADVYSLGAILRFLLTAPSSLDSASEPAVAASNEPAVPRALEAICSKAMALDPARRYSSAQEMAAEIARYLDGLPVAAYPESVFGRTVRLLSRHRVAVLLVSAYLFMRVLLLLFLGR